VGADGRAHLIDGHQEGREAPDPGPVQRIRGASTKHREERADADLADHRLNAAAAHEEQKEPHVHVHIECRRRDDPLNAGARAWTHVDEMGGHMQLSRNITKQERHAMQKTGVSALR
jgi:diadenosine tetraphosphate (Ap4A) HIT family hydrolase